MSTQTDSMPYRDRITIAQHELLCACIIVGDILARRDATEPEWERLMLAHQRLRALAELR